MNRLQYLLTKLAEEGSEVSQIALKAQQFGLHEVKAGQIYNNKQRLHAELNDLFAIILMLNEEHCLGYDVDSLENAKAQEEKILKVNKYYGYSVELGMVTNE